MLLERVVKLIGKPRSPVTTSGATVLCSPSQHMRDAATVLHTGGSLRAPCTRCGCVLTRKHNGWRPALLLRPWSDGEFGSHRSAA